MKQLLLTGMIIILSVTTTRLCGQDTLMDPGLPDKTKKIQAGGYFKGMPSLGYDNITRKITYNSVLQNRFNFRYNHSSRLNITFEIRNRFLSGDMVEENHETLKKLIKDDQGLVQASFVPVSDKKFIWHCNPDRFYVDWRNEKWQVRLGRQRINWGINMVSNPNDLFNNFSFFDFDYEERPGADALRIQHYTGNMSRIELAVSPAEKIKESVAAMLWAFNKKGYDFQVIAGYFKNRSAVGTGWAGSLGTTGFKGEVTLFNNIDNPDSMNLIMSLGLDHMFSCGIYGFAEFLYNGGHTGPYSLFEINKPMRTDNLFISKYAATVSLMYPISPVLSASLAALYMPDIKAGYLMPNLNWSVIRNLDASIIIQYFTFQKDTDLQNVNLYLQVKWSF